MVSTSNEYLKRIGYPRSWSRADEAILALRERGFPVSPAAQEIIRRYGGLNTAETRAPGKSYYFYIDPTRISACNADDLRAVHGRSDICPIGFDEEGLGLMGIGPDNTIYFEGGQYVRGETVDEIIRKLLAGEESGFNLSPQEEAEGDI